MVSKINQGSTLSLLTFALLFDLGIYAVDYESIMRLPAGLVANEQSPRASFGCRVKKVQCGSYPSFVPADMCARLGVPLWHWVFSPHPTELGAYSAPPTTQFVPTNVVADVKTVSSASKTSLIFHWWQLVVFVFMVAGMESFWHR